MKNEDKKKKESGYDERWLKKFKSKKNEVNNEVYTSLL
jgi:hypothetical protein